MSVKAARASTGCVSEGSLTRAGLHASAPQCVDGMVSRSALESVESHTALRRQSGFNAGTGRAVDDCEHRGSAGRNQGEDCMTEVSRDGDLVYFDFACPSCHTEGSLGIDSREGMDPFDCPEGCGSVFVPWKPNGSTWEIRCVVERQS